MQLEINRFHNESPAFPLPAPLCSFTICHALHDPSSISHQIIINKKLQDILIKHKHFIFSDNFVKVTARHSQTKLLCRQVTPIVINTIMNCSGLSEKDLRQVQLIQNSAARVVTRTKKAEST